MSHADYVQGAEVQGSDCFRRLCLIIVYLLALPWLDAMLRAAYQHQVVVVPLATLLHYCQRMTAGTAPAYVSGL